MHHQTIDFFKESASLTRQLITKIGSLLINRKSLYSPIRNIFSFTIYKLIYFKERIKDGEVKRRRKRKKKKEQEKEPNKLLMLQFNTI